jgi:hypothetical protein
MLPERKQISHILEFRLVDKAVMNRSVITNLNAFSGLTDRCRNKLCFLRELFVCEVGMRVFDTGSYPKGILPRTLFTHLKHKPAHSSCQRFTNPTKSIGDYNIPAFSLAFLTRSILSMYEMQAYTEFVHCEICSNRREGIIEPVAFYHADVPLSRNGVFKRERI